MSLKSTAQEILFELPEKELDTSKELGAYEESGTEFGAIEVGEPSEYIAEEEPPLEAIVEELPEGTSEELLEEPIEVHELSFDDVPGAKDAGPISEPEDPKELEVTEEQLVSDDNDARKSKKKKDDKWDWESKGASGFIVWIKDRFDSVPKHSGYDSAGLERAISYLEKLDNEISRAMRLDLDGELDADKIEQIRSKIEDGLERLHDRVDKVKSSKKGKRRKKSEFEQDGLIKEAQKITGVKGTFITVPLLISGIARVCVNGLVSAGHDIEKTYKDQVEKYNLDKREKAEVRWLLFDMGYPLRGDRGFMPEEDFDAASSDNYDYMANYKG